jgi:hypothetical protein
MVDGLAEDVKVLTSVPDPARRLRLNSGVERPSPADARLPCKHDAVVPKEDWRELTEGESTLVTAPSSTPRPCATVQIVSAPAELLEISRRIGLQELTGQEEVQRIAMERPEEFGSFMGVARRFGESLLDRKEGFSSQSVRCERNTGLRSGTLDQKSGQYVGLHIDNWDALPMHLRDNSRSRLIFNLGTEPRFAVFINLTVTRMAQMMAAAMSLPHRSMGFDHIGSFFSVFRSYPVIQLRIDPGEAYIAPVDNLFHDGTTTRKHSADITHSMLGHFRVACGHFRYSSGDASAPSPGSGSSLVS